MAKKSSSKTESMDAMVQNLMFALANMGITPEQYAEIYAFVHDKRITVDESSLEDEDDFILTPSPDPEASKKTLILKVKMQDVSKPPMWRRLHVPADFCFTQLHYAIQEAVGLSNCHLWQFQYKPYSPELEIGIPKKDEFGFGVDDCTHDADKTELTSFLAKKGDKLVYVYDFGDDWVFDITVMDVVEREDECAVCTKWKSDLQAIDNCGGPYSYLSYRELLDIKDKLTAAKRREIAQAFYFESFDDLIDYIDSNMFDIEAVNDALTDIPDQWEDIDSDD